MPLTLARLALPWLATAVACHHQAYLFSVEQDQPPAFQERYVSPTGDDSNNGSRQAPWATIEHALAQAEPGTTVTLLPGTYRERSIEASLRGLPSAPITLRAASGDAVVVDGALPVFDTQPQRAWVEHDAALGVYRSQQAFPGAERIYGALADDEGGHALVPYLDYASLAATNEDYSPTQPFYCGPGVWWNPQDERIYVRLARSRYQEQLDLKVPRLVDARRTPLRLFRRGSLLAFAAPTVHVAVQGITLRGAEYGLELRTGCRHVTVSGCRVEAGRYGVLVRGSCADLAFQDVHVAGHFPAWVPRSDVKEPAGRAPARLLQGSGMQIEGANAHVRIEKCSFTGLFDGIDTTGASSSVSVRACTFEEIRDDAFEIASSSFEVEFSDCRVTRAAAGVSWSGAVAPPRSKTGTKWIHHNVIDTSTPMLYGRRDPTHALPDSWQGPDGNGMATGRAFGLHDTGGMNDPDPWKIYQNTLIGGDDVDGEGFGLAYRFLPFDPTAPHEVLNNVMVQRGTQWIARFGRIGDGSQVFDGNVWYRERVADAPIWKELAFGEEEKDFESIDRLRRSPHGRASQAHWPAGWESRGVQGNPKLADDLTPLTAGPASRAGVDLSRRPWPGVERSGYRGALAPL